MSATATVAPMQRYQGVQKESAGYRLLTSMGWKEGEGLGAAKQGIKEHIRVRRNLENWGVGAVSAAERARDWSAGMADFHRVLSNLSEVTSQHAKSGEHGSSEESDASDAEIDPGHKTVQKTKKVTELVTELPKGRKKKDKKSKKENKKKRKEIEPTNGSIANGSKDNDVSEERDKCKDEPGGNKKRVKFATHLGRFKKRENAKMVRNYSENDLAAILGCGSGVFPSMPINAEPHDPSIPKSDSDVDDIRQSVTTGVQATLNSQKLSGAIVISDGRDSSQNDRVDEFEDAGPAAMMDDGGSSMKVPSDHSLQWWNSYFCRAGSIGSGSSYTTIISRSRGFSESDQTSLFAAVQSGATQGKMGLGRASMPKKVGGVRWSGKKMILDENEESEVANPGAKGPRSSSGSLNDTVGGKGLGQHGDVRMDSNDNHTDIIITYPRNKINGTIANSYGIGQAAMVDACVVSSQAGQTKLGTGSIKWKKVVKETLSSHKKDIKLKRLIKMILETHRLGKEAKEEVETAVTTVLTKSTRFVLDGKTVRCITS